jgi:hypothetical protein
MAEIDRGSMEGQLRGGRPKLELVTVALAAMAKVAAERNVHRERATTPRRGLMQRTSSVPLRPRSSRGLELKQAQDLLHRDLSANSIEVDTWHVCSSLGDTTARYLRTVPFRISLWGTGTVPSDDQSRRCQPAGVRPIRLACSSDSSASPRRSFWTARVSRSFVRVSTAPWARWSSTRSSRLRCFPFPSWSSPTTSRWVVSALVATSHPFQGGELKLVKMSITYCLRSG